MGIQDGSPSSSIDSSSHQRLVHTSNISRRKEELSTDLRLGLGTSTSSFSSRDYAAFFIKVHMEGIPIGRKVDLLAQDGYEDLVSTLRRLFATDIKYPHLGRISAKKINVLTYEDREGDWMIAGDVPWDIFLSSVKRLKITRGDRIEDDKEKPYSSRWAHHVPSLGAPLLFQLSIALRVLAFKGKKEELVQRGRMGRRARRLAWSSSTVYPHVYKVLSLRAESGHH